MPPRFDAELVQMIRCPVTKSDLELAPDSIIEDLNRDLGEFRESNKGYTW